MKITSTSISKTAIVLGLSLALGACSATYRNHGYAPKDSELENVIVGVDTRQSVADSIGLPSSTGVLADGAWYYVSSRVRSYAYRKPEEVERQVVAISFGSNDVVTNVERFGLEDGNVVTLSRRVTDSTVRGPGLLRQLLGNFGNFNAGDFFGQQ